MNNIKIILICFIVLFFYTPNVEGVDVNLSEKDIQEAIDLGEQQKSNVTKFLEKKSSGNPKGSPGNILIRESP